MHVSNLLRGNVATALPRTNLNENCGAQQILYLIIPDHAP